MYVINGLSIREIAEKMRGRKGCSERQLQRRYEREGWKDKRQKYVEKQAAKTEERAADSAAAIRVRQLKAYGFIHRVAASSATKVAQRLQNAVTKLDAETLKNLALTIDLAARGERAVADTRDDRVSDIFDAAGRIAEGKIDDIDDWNAEEEAATAMAVKPMADLSFGERKASAQPTVLDVEPHSPTVEDEE